MVLVLLGVLVVAALVGAFLSKLRVPPWWTLLVAAAALAIALTQRADVATCDARSSSEAVFAYGALAAVVLFAAAALTSLFDAIRFARSGEKGPASARVVPLVLGAALAFGTFVLWLFTVLTCLS
jgi:hypothetical protein